MDNRETEKELLLFAARLPALPQALVRLLDACNDPDTDILQVGAIVAQDVTITAKILRLANSAFLSTRAKFIDIEQAVIYLGVDTVRNLAISVAVHETFKDHQAPGPALAEFWHHSLLTALLAKEIAELSGHPNPAEAYLAGFLHDIGKYLLLLRFDRKYLDLLENCEDTRELLHRERAVLGISHAEAGARLIEHWHLDPSLAYAVAHHHFPPADLSVKHPVARITALAHTLAEGGDQAAIGPAAEQLGFVRDSLTSLRSEQLQRAETVAESLGIPAAAPPRPDRFRPEPAGDHLRERVASLAQVSGLLDNLVRAKTLNRAFLVLEESLQVLFDIDKIILLLPDEKNLRLAVHGSFRNRFARILKGRHIDKSPLLRRALQERALIELEKRHADSPGEAELKKIFDTLAEEVLLAVPFAIGEKQAGILLVAATEKIDPVSGAGWTLLHLSSHIGSRLLLENIKSRQAEALAEERVSAVDRIAQALAHEIATPLSIIGNYVSLLSGRDNCSEEMRDDLAIIRGELDRIGKISRQLNDLSTPPQSSGPASTDLHLLIAETLQLFEQSARLTKNAAVAYLADQKIPKIRIEPDSLRQILINLLSNSLDAVDNNGWIRVESRFHPAAGTAEGRAEDHISIAVADSGPGIDPTIADHLFRAGHSTKGECHVGLGLAIVKKLAADLRGKIRHSIGEKGETLFILDLPSTPDQ